MSRASDNQVRALRVPDAPADTARVLAPLRVLSLTGGGYRGMFTAKVLVDLCKQARRTGRLDGAFDVFGGTSIGGLMACALAVGVAPQLVLDAIDLHGPDIFCKKRQRTARRVLFGTLYDSDNLAKAIDDCLGRSALTKLINVKAGLVVPAVDWERGTVQIFMSGAMGKAHAADVTLRDVCLATSAAPTYFKPHLVNGSAMLDGGLFANNPDTLILLEIARRWPKRFAQTQMLSIGTAGADAVRTAENAEKTGLAWSAKLANYMMTVQERAAAAQAQRTLGRNRYLRVNHAPTSKHPAFENMDITDDDARDMLLKTAARTAQLTYKSHMKFVDRILADRRQ